MDPATLTRFLHDRIPVTAALSQIFESRDIGVDHLLISVYGKE